jgi:hypothetical protein
VTILGLVTDRTETYRGPLLLYKKQLKSHSAFPRSEIKFIRAVAMLKCWCNSLILYIRCHRPIATARCLQKEVHVFIYIYIFIYLYICIYNLDPRIYEHKMSFYDSFILLCLFSCFVCLLSILCIVCFYIFFVLFCILFLLLYIAVSLLFLYKFTDHCHRMET